MSHLCPILGVRTADHKHTSPIISVHCYRHSEFKGVLSENTQKVSVGTGNQLVTEQGLQTARADTKFSAEEEVIMIPIEDVTGITYKSDTKTAMQANSKSTTEPVYKKSSNCCDSCCAVLCGFCCCCCCAETKIKPVVKDTTTIVFDQDPNQSTNYVVEHLPIPKDNDGCCSNLLNCFRCWCCRKTVLVDLIKRTNTVVEQEAKRVITVSLTYSKYSHPDSASNARVMSHEDQEAYYKKRFQPDTELEFYLVNDTEAHSDNFSIKRQQAESLCRTIMHLKAMQIGGYPSETELDSILDQPIRRTYGDVYNEPKLQISLNRQNQPQLTSSQLEPVV